MSAASQPEFSRAFRTDELQDGAVSRELIGSNAECVALAARYGVDELRSISAELSVAGVGSRGLRVEGKVSAELVQSCVVTLDPVEESISEDVSVTYLPEGEDDLQDAELAAFDDEEIEPFDGESVDLGELVAQTVAAAIDPYPRTEGAEFGKPSGLGDNERDVRENPFAVLKGLKTANGNEDEG